MSMTHGYELVSADSIEQLGGAPYLHPLVIRGWEKNPEGNPRTMWQRYWALDKQPLLVVGTLASAAADKVEQTTLDGLLDSLQLKAAPTYWRVDKAGSIIPLPLDMLGVVVVDETPRKEHVWPRLPLWAASNFVSEQAGRVEALCIGHADTVRDLLTYAPTFNGVPVTWEVAPLDMTHEEAREVIEGQRPMPQTTGHFTGPYYLDWLNRPIPPKGDPNNFGRVPDTARV